MHSFCLTLDSSFVISCSTTDSKKKSVVVTCILNHSIFFDNLLIDNIACSRRSVGKTRCTVNGAIVTAERKKSEAWFHRVKNNVLLTRSVPIWTRPDPTRHKPPRYFTSRLLSCHVPFRSVLLNESLVITTAA